jgi:hypothetical protein
VYLGRQRHEMKVETSEDAEAQKVRQYDSEDKQEKIEKEIRRIARQSNTHYHIETHDNKEHKEAKWQEEAQETALGQPAGI